MATVGKYLMGETIALNLKNSDKTQ